MHPVIIESLEDYLAGELPAAVQRRVETHLESCPECRQEVQKMREISGLFASLTTADAVVPRPDFTARVLAQVSDRRAGSLWSLFSLDFAFARRVVFASLLTLAILGSYLVSRETSYSPSPSPESIIASEPMYQTPLAPEAGRDRMLVTLTSYEP